MESAVIYISISLFIYTGELSELCLVAFVRRAVRLCFYTAAVTL